MEKNLCHVVSICKFFIRSDSILNIEIISGFLIY